MTLVLEIKKNKFFDGLEVSKNRKAMREFNKYPVIYLNFKEYRSRNYETAINFIKSKITDVFKYHRRQIDGNVFTKKLTKDKRKQWNEIENEVESNFSLMESLKFLCKCLKTFYKRNIIILIDEYDKIYLNSLLYNYYDKINRIINYIFSTIFKSNEYLYFGILTGCLDIGIDSAVNNQTKCSFLNDSFFGDYYGFTEEEVNKILSNFEFDDDDKKDIKEKYDGYSCLSGTKAGIIKNLDNPFSIKSFIKNNKNSKNTNKLINYWNKFGIDNELKNIIINADFYFEKDFLNLIFGDIINVNINEILDITQDLKYLSEGNIWYILLYYGYVTIVNKTEYDKHINIMEKK